MASPQSLVSFVSLFLIITFATLQNKKVTQCIYSEATYRYCFSFFSPFFACESYRSLHRRSSFEFSRSAFALSSCSLSSSNWAASFSDCYLNSLSNRLSSISNRFCTASFSNRLSSASFSNRISSLSKRSFSNFASCIFQHSSFRNFVLSFPSKPNSSACCFKSFSVTEKIPSSHENTIPTD